MAGAYCLEIKKSLKIEVVYGLFQSITDWLHDNDATVVVYAFVYAKQVCY